MEYAEILPSFMGYTFGVLSIQLNEKQIFGAKTGLSWTNPNYAALIYCLSYPNSTAASAVAHMPDISGNAIVGACTATPIGRCQVGK